MEIKTHLRIISILLLLLLSATYALMRTVKSRFLFFPCPIDPKHEPVLHDRIAYARVKCLGDTELAVYYTAVPNQSLPFVLYSHGANSIIEFEMEFLARMSDHMNIIAFDYRGYGRSDGTPSEQAVDHDITFLLRWMADTFGIRIEDVILWGRSLGSNIIMRYIGDDRRRVLPNRVFLFTPFTRYSDVLRRVRFPAPVLAHAVGNMDVMDGVRRYFKANSRRRMLIIAMRHDALVAYANAEEIRDAAPTQVRFVALLGNHGDHFSQLAEFDAFQSESAVSLGLINTPDV